MIGLSGGPLRITLIAGDLLSHAMAIREQFHLVRVVCQLALPFDVAAEVHNQNVHAISPEELRLTILARVGPDDYLAGGGSSATSRSDTVSSSSWKCGL